MHSTYFKEALDYRLLSYDRLAVRAIVFRNGNILLIQSKKYQEIKFPGGGVLEGENIFTALKREVLEETGYCILEDITYFGYTYEKRKDENKEFVMVSLYYVCEVSDRVVKQNLQEYEIDYDYQVKWMNIDEAIVQNKLLEKENCSHIPWVERESLVLEKIKKKGLM